MRNFRLIPLGALLASAALLVAAAAATSGDSTLQPLQQGQETGQVTIKGTAILPDGNPGANLPVAIKVVRKSPQQGGGSGPGGSALSQGRSGERQMMQTLASGTTDDQGRFSLSFKPTGQGENTVTLEIGEKTRSAWEVRQVVTRGKDVDLGRVQLRAKV